MKKAYLTPKIKNKKQNKSRTTHFPVNKLLWHSSMINAHLNIRILPALISHPCTCYQSQEGVANNPEPRRAQLGFI
jgi:hypothetical protein